MHLRHPKSELGISTLLFAATFVVLAAARPTSRLSDGDSVALLTAWTTAVAASVWLAASSLACCAAAVRRSGAPRFAPRGLRRLVEIAMVTTAVVLPALPAHAAGPPSPPRDQPVVRAPDAPVPSSTAVATPTVPKVAPPTIAPARVPTNVAPATRAAPASMPRPGAGTRRHVVRPGDNLWSIARRTVTSAGRPSDTELIAYWHAVIASNRATLRSGNPSLIFPGEIVTLPPLP